ncbi:MAG: hypothetical protein KAS94_05430 [Desulfobulbaceae bacterium]|nr:hypothetical protein [Desulfobulbaceae bacterium]
MSTQNKAIKKKPVMAMLLFGCVSLTAYFYLMTHQGLVTETFTKGGWYAAFPILAAFAFSFIHGAFASNLLSVFGIEAKK